MTSQIDHLVLGAEDLSSATQVLESDFGVPFDVGGAHPVMGTHNRLLRRKPSCITTPDKVVFNG